MTLAELKVLKKQSQELLDKEFIHQVYHLGCINFVFKKDGCLRLCIDYRHLIQVKIKKKNPLMWNDDLFYQLVAHLFSNIDLLKATINLTLRVRI